MKWLFLLLSCIPTFLLAQTWQYTYDINGYPAHLSRKQDSIILISKTPQHVYSKSVIDFNGQLQRHISFDDYHFDDAQNFGEDGILALDRIFSQTDIVYGLRLRYIKDDGEVVWEQHLYHSDSLSFIQGILGIMKNKEIFLAGRTHRLVPPFPSALGYLEVPENKIVLFKLDAGGSIEWRSSSASLSDTYWEGERLQKILTDHEGNIHVYNQRTNDNNNYNDPDFTHVQHIVYNSKGEMFRMYNYPILGPTSGVVANREYFADVHFDKKSNMYYLSSHGFGGYTGAQGSLRLSKYGNALSGFTEYWQRGFQAHNGFQNAPKAYGRSVEIACHNQLMTIENHERSFNYIVKRDVHNGNLLNTTLLNSSGHSQGDWMLGTDDGVLIGESVNGYLRLTKTDCDGFFTPTRVRGRLFIDNNANCTYDIGEAVVANRAFNFRDPVIRHPGWYFRYRLRTDEFGRFEFSPIPGTYEVELNNYMPVDCDNASYFTLTAIGDTLDLEIALLPEPMERNYWQGLGTQISANRPEILVYPNPFRNQIVVELPENVDAEEVVIVLYDSCGRCVYQLTTSQKSNLLNLDLTPGMYIVKVQTGQQLFSEKIVRN